MARVINIILVAVLAVALSCDHRIEDKNVGSTFNQQARDFFLTRYASDDFSPLTAREACILKTVIEHQLDSANESKILKIGKWNVRSYFVNEISLGFKFARNEDGEFYFILIPELYKLLGSNDSRYYYQGKDDKWYPNDSSRILPVNTDLVTEFIQRKVCMANESVRDSLIQFIFSDVVRYQVTKEIFLLNVASLTEYGTIKDRVETVVSSNQDRIKIYQVPNLGFLILGDLCSSTHNIYFIPQNQRAFVIKDDAPSAYKDCL
jgi:hypothetical protein